VGRALIGHNATSKGLGGGFHREIAVRAAVMNEVQFLFIWSRPLQYP
jgi:hypothetical protein